ncbi:DUF3987 domain-containing protein [Pseudomonas putida]|nr:DUF3987 domain-containing protein [Pseudomonas putida]
MADVIGVPSARAAQSVLATAALASQAHANVHLDGRIYPLSLCLLTVACSGDRKSAVDHVALQAVRDWERQQWIAYGEHLKAHPAAMSLTAKSPTSKKSAQLALDAQPEPVQPKLLSAEPTIEGLVKSLCHGLPIMGVFSDEGGQFLGGSTMSRDNMIKAITHLSTLWDGSPIDRSRAMSGKSLRAYDRRLSMHLMLQPHTADRLLQDVDIKDQGILGRCLISWPERLVGQRLYKAIDLTRDPKVHLYQQRIAALMQKPWSRHKDGGLNPAALELSPRAREAPSQALGQHRSNVRTRAPDGQDYQGVQRVALSLVEHQYEQVAAVIMLARTTGMRLREAILADLPRLHREAESLGRINFQDGTKGGRSGASAPRWIMANEAVKAALQLAFRAAPTGSSNLLARNESYAEFLHQTVLPTRETLHKQELKGFHQLRAAYACERYEQLTGHAAPVNGGHRYRVDSDLDRQARLQISLELGHNRIDVVSAYIGGRA